MKMVSQRMNDLCAGGRKLLVGYVVAGYPSEEAFFRVLEEGRDALDIWEVGFPSANPFADGPVIADAHRKVNREVVCDIAYWERIRAAVPGPIWVMGYQEDLVDTGICLQLAERHLIDVLVLPGADEAVMDTLAVQLAPYGVDVIRFLNPAMTKDEMAAVLEKASVVYEQLYVGKTGATQHEDNYADMLAYSKTYPAIRAFGGFGISTGEKVAEVCGNGFDGAIIGTELIRRMNVSVDEFAAFVKNVHRVVEQV